WAVDSPPAAPSARCPDAAGNAVVSAAGATGSVGAVVSSGPDDPAPDDPGPGDEEAAVDGPGAGEAAGRPTPGAGEDPLGAGPLPAGSVGSLIAGSSLPEPASDRSSSSGSSALRAMANSASSAARFIRRTPLVCRPALRTCLANVRMIPPLEVMA